MEEVTDPKTAGTLCMGLGHPFRIKVIQVLNREGGKMFVSDLIKECAKDSDYYQQYTSAKFHIKKMEEKGIVALTKERKELMVTLKMNIKIYVEEAEGEQSEKTT